MVLFVTIVNGFQPLTIARKISMLGVSGVVNSLLVFQKVILKNFSRLDLCYNFCRSSSYSQIKSSCSDKLYLSYFIKQNFLVIIVKNKGTRVSVPLFPFSVQFSLAQSRLLFIWKIFCCKYASEFQGALTIGVL